MPKLFSDPETVRQAAHDEPSLLHAQTPNKNKKLLKPFPIYLSKTWHNGWAMLHLAL